MKHCDLITEKLVKPDFLSLLQKLTSKTLEVQHFLEIWSK